VYAAQSSLDVYQRVIINNKRWVRESSELTETWATAIKRWAWDAVTSMQELAVAVPVDMSDIWLACKYRDYHDDYEDDLVLAACRRAHADYLVTNDRKLLAHADVCAKTPRQMVELLKVLS
jgi:predicted nucleic acid-binding protein